jgi:hypothetical protein
VTDEPPPQINLDLDTSIKDWRGPAQAQVVTPSNRLLLISVVGAIGWLGLLILLIIPVAFPLPEKDEGPVLLIGAPGSKARREAEEQLARKSGKGQKSMFRLLGYDLGGIANWPTHEIFLAFLVPVLGALYSGCAAAGAVQIQNLRSRRWGRVGCILALFPFNTAGIAVVVAVFFQLGMSIFGVDEEVLVFPVLGLAIITWLLSVGAGVSALVVLTRPEVVKGFKYRAQ